MSRKTLLCAEWIEPIASTMLRDGAVVFENGRILAVGSARSLAVSHPDADRVDLGSAIVLPGLVNAHTHLELSNCTPGEPAESFVDWVMRLRATPSNPTAIEEGLRQCGSFGVTCVGDITNQPRPTTDLRLISYREVRAMAQRRRNLPAMLDAARSHDGVSPHAPYSVEPDGFRACLELAQQHGIPLTTHLAEFADERAFLSDHSGMLRNLWNAIGGWDDAVPTFAGGPIRFAKSLGLLDQPLVSLAHVNYCDDDELDILAGGKASVVYCPRTHRHFGHPPHRWREMLDRGTNVAVGTDSCASSPDLNLVDELRLLHEMAPNFPARELWRMATMRGAQAVGLSHRVGQLVPGRFADFVVFDAATDQPLTEILEKRVLPREVWVGGRRLTHTRPASPC